MKPVSGGFRAKGRRWFSTQRLVPLAASVQHGAAGADVTPVQNWLGKFPELNKMIEILKYRDAASGSRAAE